MKPKIIQPSNYGFATAVFLVLALGLISALTYFNNKNSQDLTQTVNNLKDNKYDIDKIDKAIQLLYRAENNSREYILTRDAKIKIDYINQLTYVSVLVDSIVNTKRSGLRGLVEDKRIKTEIFIRAKILADSLIRVNSKNTLPATSVRIKVNPLPKTNVPVLPVRKVVTEKIVAEKNRKKLFQRIKEAIVNKPQEKEINNITIFENHTQKDTAVTTDVIQVPIEVQSPNNEFALRNLSDKEKLLLEANRKLFQELQDLLESLKRKEHLLYDQRQQKLSENANEFISKLKNNSTYNLILSIVLTCIILIIFARLFKNGQDLQKAKLKAEEYANSKSEFIALLSHEIRTPLHCINAYSDELSTDNDEAKQSETIDAIKVSSNILLSIVNNILDFTKIEKGKFKLNHSPFSPAKVIQEVLSGLSIQASKKNLFLHGNIEASTNQMLYGDAFYFRQLLINIISNSIKYTNKGSIVVNADFMAKNAISGVLYVKIKDTGIGIENKKLPHIFDEYSAQTHKSEVKEGSTGLGLSVVKKVIDYHKGKISVESKINYGTSFDFEIPYDVYVSNEAPSLPNDAIKTILMVENDRLTSKYLNMLFKDDKYHVTNVSNGEAAFTMLIENEFDLMITDISMPGLNGYQLARKIRGLSNTHKSAIPIIALTGFDVPEDSQEGQIADFNAWIIKPFNADDLLSKVEELCGL